MIRCDIRATRWSEVAAALLPKRRNVLWNDPVSVPVHSDNAGLSHVFSFLRASEVLENKNSKVLISPSMDQAAHHAIRSHGFPVLHEDAETRAVVVSHQFGFPQDLDEIRSHCQHRRIVVIEDCAQALGGTYKGRPLGSDGLAGIFSLSHFFPSLTGGAVVSGDARLRAHVARLEQAGTRALALFSFCIKLALQNHARTSKTAGFALRLDEFASAGDPHSSRLLLAENICGLKGVRDELEVRRRNYQLYRRLLPDHAELQALEADAVPQVLPLMHPSREALEKTAFSLRGLGLDTGVHLFDANRNIFNERRVPCVPLPVHGGIDTALVGRVVEIIRRHR